MFEPGESVTDALQDVHGPDAVCQLPDPTFTSTLLRPTLSAAVPLTVIEAVVNTCPFVGDVIEMVGSVVSGGSYVTVTDVALGFPEVSVALA